MGPDHKVRASQSRAERGRREKELRDLAAELVVTADGRAYAEAVKAIPAEDWDYFYSELYRGLSPYFRVPCDPATLPPNGTVLAVPKSDYLRRENLRRKQAERERWAERAGQFAEGRALVERLLAKDGTGS